MYLHIIQFSIEITQIPVRFVSSNCARYIFYKAEGGAKLQKILRSNVDLHDRGGEGTRYREAVTNNEGALLAIVFGQ